MVVAGAAAGCSRALVSGIAYFAVVVLGVIPLFWDAAFELMGEEV